MTGRFMEFVKWGGALSLCRVLAHLVTGPFDLADRLLGLGKGQGQRRQEANAIVTAASHQQLLIASHDHELAIVRD